MSNVSGESENPEGEPFEFPIELGKIREFGRALHSQNPVWYSEAAAAEAGLDGVPIPPTFPISTAFWDPPPPPGREKLALDLRFILHGEQEFEFFGPPPVAGDNLTGRQRLVSVFEKEGKRGGTMTFVVTETTFYDESGKPVMASRGTLIQTGQVVKRED